MRESCLDLLPEAIRSSLADPMTRHGFTLFLDHVGVLYPKEVRLHRVLCLPVPLQNQSTPSSIFIIFQAEINTEIGNKRRKEEEAEEVESEMDSVST